MLVHLIGTTTNTPVLAYQDFNLTFPLHESGSGLACALYQTENNIQRVIGFASCTLIRSRKK